MSSIKTCDLLAVLAMTTFSSLGAPVAHYALNGNGTSSVNSPAADGSLVGTASFAGAASPAPGSTASLSLDHGANALSVATGAIAINGSYTVAGWANVDTLASLAGATTIVGAYQTASPFEHNYLIRVFDSNSGTNSGKLGFIARDDGGNTLNISTGSAIALDTWFHFAATFDSATREGILYVNGDAAGSTTMAAFVGFAAPTVAGIGGFNISTANSMNGLVDDLRIYDHVLTESEIETIISPFGLWATQITNGKILRHEDADDDSFTNLQEFLFGTDPMLGNGSLTSTETSGGDLIIRWKQLTSGASYNLKESVTLANDWLNATSATIETDGATVGDYQPMKGTIDMGPDKSFFRVEGAEN